MFFARRDSGIRSLDDLRGRSIAFQNPSSTSAYFVPAAELLDQGLPLEILLSPMDRPDPGAVGYLFARSELNIATWVHKRLVDVGVMSNLDWQNPQRVPRGVPRRPAVVIRETADYPRALEMVRGDLDPQGRGAPARGADRGRRRSRRARGAAALLQDHALPADRRRRRSTRWTASRDGVQRIRAEVE